MKKDEKDLLTGLMAFLDYISRTERRPLSDIIAEVLSGHELCKKHLAGFSALKTSVNKRPNGKMRVFG